MTALWRHKLSDRESEFENVIFLSKMSELLRNFVIFLKLFSWPFLLVFGVLIVDRDFKNTTIYRHLIPVVSLTYPYEVIQTTWSRKLSITFLSIRGLDFQRTKHILSIFLRVIIVYQMWKFSYYPNCLSMLVILSI